MGVTTASDATFATMAENIKTIQTAPDYTDYSGEVVEASTFMTLDNSAYIQIPEAGIYSEQSKLKVPVETVVDNIYGAQAFVIYEAYYTTSQHNLNVVYVSPYFEVTDNVVTCLRDCTLLIKAVSFVGADGQVGVIYHNDTALHSSGYTNYEGEISCVAGDTIRLYAKTSSTDYGSKARTMLIGLVQ